MATSQISAPKSPTSPPLSSNSNSNSNKSSWCNPLPSSPRVMDSAAILAYEQYLRLPELSKRCTSNNFPDWRNEPILKPALQALEITFRLLSISLSDPRPYSNTLHWKRRLESLSHRQIDLISTLCEHEPGSAPVADLTAANGVLAREKSSHEVWKLNATTTIVSETSVASLLPRLASWYKSEDVAAKILMQIECQMHRCPFTLGLGEPNLAGKPSLQYDLIVRPTELHALKKSPLDHSLINDQENQTLFTIHQILESWLCAAKQLLTRISSRIDAAELDEAAADCWLLERIWELLSEVEGLHLLMDPDDFLRLKSQLAIRATTGSESFCFRSRALLEVTNLSRDLKHKVPQILGVEVDPNGGPRVQEAAMRLLHSRPRGEGDHQSGKLHLLQAFQAIEVALKKFFFGYRQLVTAVFGSLEANGNRGLGFSVESSDSLTQMFMDPPYFPSLDAAKTFLSEFWQCELRSSSGPLNNGKCGVVKQQ